MKKNLALSLIVALAVASVSRVVLASGAQGSGGIVAVMVAIIDADNGGSSAPASKDDQSFNTHTLKGEFAALNNSPESVKLIQQTAGGSADLKAILASN